MRHDAGMFRKLLKRLVQGDAPFLRFFKLSWSKLSFGNERIDDNLDCVHPMTDCGNFLLGKLTQRLRSSVLQPEEFCFKGKAPSEKLVSLCAWGKLDRFLDFFGAGVERDISSCFDELRDGVRPLERRPASAVEHH